jgi:hypothetical protein
MKNRELDVVVLNNNPEQASASSGFIVQKLMLLIRFLFEI